MIEFGFLRFTLTGEVSIIRRLLQFCMDKDIIFDGDWSFLLGPNY